MDRGDKEGIHGKRKRGGRKTGGPLGVAQTGKEYVKNTTRKKKKKKKEKIIKPNSGWVAR